MLIKTQQIPFPDPGCKSPTVDSGWKRLNSPTLNVYKEDAKRGRGRREGGSGWGTHVNPWLIHVNAWQKPLQERN